MTEQPFDNESSQQDRRDLLENHLRLRSNASTYHSHTDPALEEGGRYAKRQPSHVVGSAPVVDYPGEVPAWVKDRGPDEPALGYSVEDHDAVGEPHEIAASLSSAASAPAEPATEVVTPLPLCPPNSAGAASSLAEPARAPVPEPSERARSLFKRRV